MSDIGNLDDFDPYFGLDFGRVEDDYLCDDFDPYDYGYSLYSPSYPEFEAFDHLPDMPVLCFEDSDEDDPDDTHLLFV